jgi:hypothetical protein
LLAPGLVEAARVDPVEAALINQVHHDPLRYGIIAGDGERDSSLAVRRLAELQDV